MNPYFRDYADFLASYFEGKVQKISVDAAMGCPNRDGTTGHGGCIYCNNKAFSPDWQKHALPVDEQIARGKEFFSRKYPQMRYLAYFQSYTSTHAPLPYLLELYRAAIAQPDIVGIIIGTRPDCMPDALLDRLSKLRDESGSRIFIEFGAESSHDITLRRINRGHDFAAAERAIRLTAERGIHVGAHFILGLPDESDEMMIAQAERINSLPLDTVKFHQLQLFRGTALAAQYDACPQRFRFRTVDEYLDLFVEILRRLRPDLVIERFAGEAPPRYHHIEGWGLIRNETLMAMLDAKLERCGAYQGDMRAAEHD